MSIQCLVNHGSDPCPGYPYITPQPENEAGADAPSNPL